MARRSWIQISRWVGQLGSSRYTLHYWECSPCNPRYTKGPVLFILIHRQRQFSLRGWHLPILPLLGGRLFCRYDKRWDHPSFCVDICKNCFHLLHLSCTRSSGIMRAQSSLEQQGCAVMPAY